MQSFSFSDWILLQEGGINEADIPPFLYVGIYFSEDLVKRYPFTPRDAACSLVGLEGITKNPSTALRFSPEATLKMPGKMTVKLNKISPVDYENPHYMASAGFRTPRRLKAGSAPLAGGTKSYSSEQVVNQVVSGVLYQIHSELKNIARSNLTQYASGIISGTSDKEALHKGIEAAYILGLDVSPLQKLTEDTNQDISVAVQNLLTALEYNTSSARMRSVSGESFEAKDVTNMLKRLKPIRGNVFRGMEQPETRPWGSRASIHGRNIKPERFRHLDKPLKSLRSADDLAYRLMVLLRGLMGDTADIFTKTGNHEEDVYVLKSDDMYFTNGRWVGSKNEPPKDVSKWSSEKTAKEAAAKLSQKLKRPIEVKEHQVKVPNILHWTRAAASAQGSSFSGEGEWVLKRQTLPGIYGQRCPACGKYNNVTPGEQTIVCKGCSKEYEVKDIERGARPLLNVPYGSILNIIHPNSAPAWIRKYIPAEKYAAMTEREKYNYIIERFKLHKKFQIYFEHTQAIQDQAVRKPYDPERAQTAQSMKDAIERGINKPNILEKWISHKHGPAELESELAKAKAAGDAAKVQELEKEIDSIREGIKTNVRSVLNRWEQAGLTKVDDKGNLRIINPDMTEDALAVYECIKRHADTSVASIAEFTGLETNDINQALQWLLGKGKIQKLIDNKYEIVLSPEEMNTITEDEQKLLTAIKKSVDNDIYELASSTSMEYEEVRKLIRLLMIKKRIFKSPWSGNYRVMVGNHEPLSPNEIKVLEYLKKYPNTDRFSLINVFKKWDVLTKVLDNLAARSLITVKDQYVSLNKDKVQDFKKDASPHSQAASMLYKTLVKHFVTRASEIASIRKWNRDQTEEYVNILFNDGVLKRLDTNRIVPADPAIDSSGTTVEETIALNKIKNVSSITSSQMTKVINDELKMQEYPQYQSTNAVLYTLVHKNLIKRIDHPFSGDTYYYAADKGFEIDTKEEEQRIIDALSVNNKPMNYSDLIDYVNDHGDWLGYEAVTFVLKKMLDKPQPPVKSAVDFTDETVYFLANAPGPKSADEYFNVVVHYLSTHGPTDAGMLESKLVEETGLSHNAVAKVLKLMLSMPQPLIQTSYSEVTDDNILHLPNQKIPSIEDFKGDVFDIIQQEGQGTVQAIRTVLINKGKVIRVSGLKSVLNLLINDGAIKQTIDYSGSNIYHLPSVDPLAKQKQKIRNAVIDFVTKKNNHAAYTELKSYVLYNQYMPSLSVAHQVILDFIQEGLLYVKQGDINDKNYWWQTVLTLDKVDPSQVIKDASIPKVEAAIHKYVQSSGAIKITLGGIANYIIYNQGIVPAFEYLIPILNKLMQEGKIVPMSGADLTNLENYWNIQVTIPGVQAPTPEPALQPAAAW